MLTAGWRSSISDFLRVLSAAPFAPACAVAGLQSLCKADRRYTPFAESLFSRASLSITRDQLTKDENEQLDTNLKAFLRVLVNHFLQPAAFQVLEYCVRRYQ